MHKPLLSKKMLILLLLQSVNLLFAKDVLTTDQLEALEESPATIRAAKIAAAQQGLPIKMLIANKAVLEVITLTEGNVNYKVITNFRHPERGAYLASYSEIINTYDLTTARRIYADGRVVNPISLPADSRFSTQTPGDTFLMVPDSQADRVMLLDIVNGDLIDPNFVPANPANLGTPVQAQQHPFNFVTVSDQLSDAVLSYDTSGVFLGIFAPAGGVNNNILDNARGHTYLSNNHLLVCNFDGGNAHAVVEFDSAGNYIGNFIAPGAGGLESPWDLLFRDNDLLVSASGTDAVLRFDHDGNFLDIFADSLNFPRQMVRLPDGAVAVANFSPGPESGIYIFSDDGSTQLNWINTIGSNRGLFLLKNGNMLTSNGTGIWEIDLTTGALVDSIINLSGQHFGLYIVPGSGVADIAFSPAEIDFDTVEVGTTAEESIKIFNTGSAPLEVNATIESFNTPFTVSPTELTIAEGDSAFFTVSYQPIAQGLDLGNLKLMHNTPAGQSDIPLQGVGKLPAVAGYAFSPDTVDFDSVKVGESASDTITIYSVGTAALEFIANVPALLDFTIDRDTASIAPGDSLKLVVTFSPATEGLQTGQITFISNAPVSEFGVTVRGIGVPPTGISDGGIDQPEEYNLSQNYPNPFNPSTTIGYALPQRSFVNISVYDVQGRRIAELVEGWKNGGNHTVTFDAAGLASGIYYYKITAGEYQHTRKMLLIK